MIKPGYIYLIQAQDTDLYKIGLTTRSVEERLRELNGSQSPHELLLIHSIWVNDVHEAERYFHTQCQEYHYRREWFRFSDNVVLRLVELMDEYVRPQYAEVDDEVFDIRIPLVTVLLVLTGIFLFVQCGRYSNPEFQDCVRYGGGNACTNLVK